MTGQTMDPTFVPIDDGTPPVPGRRTLRSLVFMGMAVLVAAMLAFAVWYLVNRKPISQLPLPGVTTEIMPHYSTSFYGVGGPTGVAVNADGSRIYAVQSEGDAAVIVFDGAGNQVGQLTLPPELGVDHVFVYAALSPLDGTVAVSDRPAGAVHLFDADGAYRGALDPGADLAGWQPLGLAYGPDGSLYVTDMASGVAHRFGPDGSLAATYGSAGDFAFPNGIAVDDHGDVYVSDSNNGRLFVFDEAGTPLARLSRGTAEANLGLPRGIATDGKDHVYVTDIPSQSVQVYHQLQSGERTLKYSGSIGQLGSEDGAFRYPNAVAADSRGHVYVADWRNNRIQLWSY